ncbi:LacI family DNA-binding transcriptional regulator [Microbacterium aurantiacum]|uniref:LacI family DNA-binding transcriptional regulator n=1 Tax=Microbacterium aurantiacum TaxID=162393 RepID=UPI003D7357CA
MLGLALSNVANPFYPELSVAFCAAAARRGFGVFLAHTGDDDDSASRTIRSMIERGVDGIAIAVARSDSAKAVRDMRRARLPFVQISRAYTGISSDFVGIDDLAAARQIAAHALGHRRGPIATVVGPHTSSASADRESGFVAEARAAGTDLPAEYRVSVPLTLEGGRAAAAHLLALPVPPKFVLCGSDVLALGVMTHAQSRGLDVPRDIAVTGFDGIEVCATEMIRLTGVVQPHVDMARSAVDLLIDRISGRRSALSCVRIPHALSIGRTCGCPREEREH